MSRDSGPPARLPVCLPARQTCLIKRASGFENFWDGDWVLDIDLRARVRQVSFIRDYRRVAPDGSPEGETKFREFQNRERFRQYRSTNFRASPWAWTSARISVRERRLASRHGSKYGVRALGRHSGVSSCESEQMIPGENQKTLPALRSSISEERLRGFHFCEERGFGGKRKRPRK